MPDWILQVKGIASAPLRMAEVEAHGHGIPDLSSTCGAALEYLPASSTTSHVTGCCEEEAMAHRIHTFGASGSGTSTLGSILAERLNARHLDTDAFYWLQSDPPFTHKRPPADRIAIIESEIDGEENWVLSGSICSWGDPLLRYFTSAVFLHIDPVIRMARLAERERRRYGARILPGGDMHVQHQEFMDWAGSYDNAKAPIRSLDLHERWMRRLLCPIIRLDASRPVDELCDEVLNQATGKDDP